MRPLSRRPGRRDTIPCPVPDVVHRDIKPDNVLLSDGHAVVQPDVFVVPPEAGRTLDWTRMLEIDRGGRPPAHGVTVIVPTMFGWMAQ